MAQKAITTAILIVFTSFQSLACNWSEDVVRTSKGTYEYSKECHLEVGKSLDKLDLKEEQVEKLEKSLEFKDLVIITEKKRVNNWKDLSHDLESRIDTLDKIRGAEKWLWFGLGIVATSLAIKGAKNL